MSDLKTMKQAPPEGVSASPLGDENLLIWGGTIIGPDDTPWEGGIFSMRLTFTEQYPDKPPRVRFTSEMVRPCAAPFCTGRPAICAQRVVRRHNTRRMPLSRYFRATSALRRQLARPSAHCIVRRPCMHHRSSTRTFIPTALCAWT